MRAKAFSAYAIESSRMNDREKEREKFLMILRGKRTVPNMETATQAANLILIKIERSTKISFHEGCLMLRIISRDGCDSLIL